MAGNSFPFVGGAYEARSNTFDSQRCLNLYPEISGDGTSKSVAALFGTPGLRLLTTLAGGNIRGMIKLSATLSLIVAGTAVYSVSTAFAGTALVGTIDGLTTPVSMAYNGTIVMLVTGPNGYVVSPVAGTVVQITDSDFYGADDVAFLDGYFVFNRTGTGQFQITQLYGAAIDPLDFATAEGAPDIINAMAVDHREIWLFGDDTIEVWYNAGTVDFPFQRIQGAFLEIGCAAVNSVAKLDNSLVWMASDARGQGTIQRAVGYAPQRISTHAVEYAIGTYAVTSDAVAFSYLQEGHLFYQISFPSAGATWVYDAATSLWHERAYRDPSTGKLGRHRANVQMNFAGMVVVGDYANGNVYEYDLDTYSDNGAVIPRIRATPHLAGSLNYVAYDSLQIDMETGVGLADGSDPQIMLRWSDDGGFSWSNELWTSAGKIGARNTRAIWRRLGVSRDRVFEVTITDPIKVAFIGATVATRGATS